MPPSVTADTGIDVLAHSIESLIASRANPMSDILAERAVTLVMEHLPRAVKDGSDIEARTQMSFAATLGGWAFTSSTTHLGHAFGHALGSLFHIPHGNACGVALPEIVEFIADSVPDGTKRAAAAMGLKVGADVSAAQAGIMVREAMIEFNKRVGQKTLKQLGIKESQLPEIAKAISTEFLVNASPKKTGEEDILKMLQKAYTR
jgi:alcohol dehydrogenase